MKNHDFRLQMKLFYLEKTIMNSNIGMRKLSNISKIKDDLKVLESSVCNKN